jgi:hypothetical protein
LSLAQEFADMNYHTGQRKGDGKIITIQQCANVYRDDATTDALLDFPLEEKHTLAFDAPDGWLDSWWHSDVDAVGLIVLDEDGGPESAADEMRHGRNAFIEVEVHLLPDRTHREWLDSSEGAFIEKSEDDKDVTVRPAIMVPSGSGLVTVARERVELHSTEIIVGDNEPLTVQEWETIEAMSEQGPSVSLSRRVTYRPWKK